MIIGLFQRVEGRYFWPLYRGAVEAARHAGARVVAHLSPTPRHQRDLDGDSLRHDFLFDPSRYDGLLFGYGADAVQRYADDLWSQGKPVVLLGRRFGALPCVVNDNREPIRAMVKTLYARGHRRIGFIDGLAGNFGSEERCIGYLEGLEQCGLKTDASLLVPGQFSEEIARDNVRAAMEKGLEVTAWIAANDFNAFGVLDALHELGKRVPEDVEVVGFDNLARTKWSDPPLSTFDPQLYQIGYAGTEELIRRVRGEKGCQEIVLPTIYRGRASTREAPAAPANRPLSPDWAENQFYYEVQWDLFRRTPAVAQLVEQMEASLRDPVRFLESFRALLAEAKARQVDPACIDAYLHEIEVLVMCAAATTASVGELVSGEAVAKDTRWFDQALALQTAAMFEEQKRLYEITTHFQAASTRLRELTFEAAEEPIVLARFWQTLRSLNVGRAGLYLHAQQGGPTDSQMPFAAQWFWKDASIGPRHIDPAGLPTNERDLLQLLPVDEASDWLVIPLLYERDVLGVMVFGSDMDYVVHYPELTNQFSVGLHGARMHFALKRTHAELVEASRLAGLAEMATGVLHNIGNALNGVNTTVGVVSAQVQKSRIPNVQKTARLLAEHQGPNLAAFLAEDPRGKQIAGYLEQLGQHLLAEQQALVRDLEDLRFKVDHINQIVAAQQSYAQFSGLVETMAPAELFDHALKISEASLMRHRVAVRRDFAPVPPVHGQRQKILQILVNLIRNAKEAMAARERHDKHLVLGLEAVSLDRVRFIIGDNGVGIPPENLTRIFAFGFSTKEGGRGFGLHTSALAAKEMGGSLFAKSAGVGQGATFILELPAATGSPV